MWNNMNIFKDKSVFYWIASVISLIIYISLPYSLSLLFSPSLSSFAVLRLIFYFFLEYLCIYHRNLFEIMCNSGILRRYMIKCIHMLLPVRSHWIGRCSQMWQRLGLISSPPVGVGAGVGVGKW